VSTTFLVIRHALNDMVDYAFAGWMPGVHLNERGRQQAERLAERLAGAGLAAIVSSPLERALQTAEPLAQRLGIEVQTAEGLGEIRIGDWTNRTFAEIEDEPLWKRFNMFRGGTRAPGGELMLETQLRMVLEMERLRPIYAGQRVALISHGDPIRAVVTHFAGMPIDMFARLEISPASISVIRYEDWGARVLSINDTAHLESIGSVLDRETNANA
jgi:probable phosphomutase (TIGR03848 family)